MSAQTLKITLHSIWLKVQEPRALSVIYFFAYLAIGLLGMFVATDPPRNVASSLGTGLLTFWGGLLLVGGALGSFSVLPGIWWLERAATLMCMTAVGIYGVTMAAAPVTQLSLRMASLCFITFSILAFAARLVKIRHYAYDPEK
jgi:hypothetical protein